MNKKIIAMIMTAVMLFPTTSITALASNSGLEVQGSNSSILSTSDELESGNYTVEDKSTIVEETENEVTVDNKSDVTTTDSSQSTENTQKDTQQESVSQTDSQTSYNTEASAVTNQTTDSTLSNVTPVVNAVGPKAVGQLKYEALDYKTIKISWDVSVNATQYNIYRSTNKEGNFEQITTTKDTSYTEEVSCGQVYYYKIMPYQDNLAGEESIIGANTKPEKAGKLKASVTNITVKLTWKAGKGATYYNIYRSESKDSGFVKIAETEKLSYSDKNPPQGKSYYYRICSASNNTEGDSVTTSKSSRIPAGPKAVKSLKYKANDYKTVTLSWKSSKGATKYIIFRSTSENENYKKVKTTNETTYKQSNLTCGKTYYYKIVPYADSIPGKEKVIKAYTKPAKITKLKASVSGTTIKLTWKKGKGATSYFIYRSTNKSSGFEKIGESTSTKYYDNNLTTGKTYYYRVYSVSNGVKGSKVTCSATIPKEDVPISTPGEMRAAWISYLDYGTLKDRSKSEFTRNVDAMYDRVTAQNLNTVIVHVRAFSDAIYPSQYYGWANFVTSDSNGPDYDPLAIMIEEAHKKGLSFHAWINPYRTVDGGRVNPASSSAVKKIVNGVEEIVTNYNVDGIHFDDYFYLSTDGTSQDEKMQNVNNMVGQVYAKIKSIKPNVVFGISPAGNIEYAKSIGCDVDTWLSSAGYVDYVCPQLYWSDDYVTKSGASTKMFTNTMKQWVSINRNNTTMYAGLALYKVGTSLETAWGSDYGWGNSTSNLYDQYKAAKNSGYRGYSLYRYGSFDLSAAPEELANLKKLSQ